MGGIVAEHGDDGGFTRVLISFPGESQVKAKPSHYHHHANAKQRSTRNSLSLRYEICMPK
jgi:hypothetical protein